MPRAHERGHPLRLRPRRGLTPPGYLFPLIRHLWPLSFQFPLTRCARPERSAIPGRHTTARAQSGVRTGGTWAIEVLPNLGAGETYPVDVNDDGWVTGTSNLTSGKTHAILWRPGQPMKDLGAMQNDSWAKGITPAGAVEMLVVGLSSVGSVNRAVLWRPGSRLVPAARAE